MIEDVLIVLMILVFVVAIFAIVWFAVYVPNHPKLIEVGYVVAEGDTLWSIAEEYCPSDIDLWAYITKVREANGLSSGDFIYPGQYLIIYEKR